MRIHVRIKPRAKQSKVEKIDDGHFTVFVTSPPIEGKANEAMISLLADYFDIAKSRITIIAGKKGRDKILDICF